MTAFRSIRVRLTIWYVLLLAVILAVFSAGVYVALRESLNRNLNDTLETDAEVLESAVEVDNGRPRLSPVTAPGHIEGEQFARVFDASGVLTFDNALPSASPAVDQDAIGAALSGRTTRRSAQTSKEGLRVLTLPIRRDGVVIGALEVGRTEDDVEETLRVLLIIIAIAYPLTLVVASAGGVFLAGRALKPIGDLTSIARQITAEDLSKRLDMKLPDDEVGRLAQTFNDMIARLDEAFRRQRQFTADASHELRTPLTAIKGQTEVALQRERDPQDYREVLGAVNSEVDRMIRLVGSLLSLARADSGHVPIARERIDLGQIVSDAAEQMRPAATAKDIALEVQASPPIPFLGDEDLLLQLVLNLLDNAVKYTPAGGAVTVAWATEGDPPRRAAIRVTDSGPGIAEEHLPRIFDRFYRVDQSRNQASGGSGLGLSISRWIAEAHGGTLTAESAPGSGSTFTVRLPLTSS
jgi:heavy metal sensor kinase